MGLWQSILMAVSLCADCLAVSLCSGVAVRNLKFGKAFRTALVFAFVQTGFLLAGWLFGHLLSALLVNISHFVGFLLLLYVGAGMVREGIENKGEARNLDGFRNVVLGGIATSIDALAVGASISVTGAGFEEVRPLVISVCIVTLASVLLGLYGGSAICVRFGRWAEIAGGLVLTGIGISLLLH